MSPETYEQLKQLASIGGAAVATGWGAWKLAIKKLERERTPVYQGAPDDSPRKISRREWHGVLNKFQLYEMKFDAHQHLIDNLSDQVERLDRSDESRGVQIAKILEGTIRTEEQFAAHRVAWTDAGKRAEEDRRELLATVKDLALKVDALRVSQ